MTNQSFSAVYRHTLGSIFLGTPHRGSHSASIGVTASRAARALGISANDRLVKALLEGSETLERINEAFAPMIQTLAPENILRRTSYAFAVRNS
jgi:hypothetical protein